MARNKLECSAKYVLSSYNIALEVQGLKKGAGAGAKKAALKGAQKLSKKELEQAALKTALERRQRKRQRAPGVDVPALDRNASGPDALAVMRQARLAVLYYADTA